jgi:hypothetical protein
MAKLLEANATPAALTSDLDFLRRVTLDATGLIPTPEQVRAFIRGVAALYRQTRSEQNTGTPRDDV